MFKELESRRSFIKTLSKYIVSLVTFLPFTKSLLSKPLTLQPRERIANPFVTPDGRPILVCVKGTNFKQMLIAGLSAIGGLDKLIGNHQDVLIKPNCVYTEEYPTTSDIDSIVATIESVRMVTSGAINVGDAGAINNQDIYRFLQLYQAITQAGGTLITFSDVYDVRRDTWEPDIPDFKVYTDIYDAPLIVNLCSLKRHYKAFLTCAIKHHVGTISGPYRTDTRYYIHTFPDRSIEFLHILAELAGLINPELSIVDARSIMAINGPLLSYGGEIREVNKIVICGDMVATDAYCAQLMEENDETFNAHRIQPTLQRAEELGLGIADLRRVKIIEFDITSYDDSIISSGQNGIGLHQNLPNPFNPTTRIIFTLPENSHVTLKVYDILGREVATLVDGICDAGEHSTTFNGMGLSSGTYLYKLITPRFTQTKAMVLVK